MISKELLSEVLGIEAKHTLGGTDDTYMLWRNDGDIHKENIYELAHKCKEWADKQNIGIKSYIWFGTGKVVLGSMDDTDTACSGVEFYDNTEPEAIFKACEWILNDRV